MSKAPKKDGAGANKKRKANPSSSSSKVCDDDQLLSCPVCLDPFTGKVYQCPQGHGLCEICINNVRGMCPSCRGPINKTIRNIIAEQLAQKAPTGCGFKNCDFVGPRSEINTHHRKCERRPLKCPMSECVWRGETSDEFFAHLHSNHTGIGVEDTLNLGESYTFCLSNPNNFEKPEWWFPMRLGDDSFIVGCSRYFGSNMIATVLSVGASRDCKWDIEMGMEFSEYHSFGSNTMSGIKDCSFEDVVKSGRVLSVPDASILRLCEEPREVKAGDSQCTGINKLQLVLTIS